MKPVYTRELLYTHQMSIADSQWSSGSALASGARGPRSWTRTEPVLRTSFRVFFLMKITAICSVGHSCTTSRQAVSLLPSTPRDGK